jgi:hypothetical protein
MVVDGVSGPISAAHLHKGFLNANGPVVHNLTNEISGNGILHLGAIDDGVLSSLLTGEIYINAHSAAFPGGEVRGQMFRRARDGYGFDMCAEQEVGKVNAPGSSGSGLVSIDRNHSNINMFVVTDGLTGDITGAHIHQAAIGVNGGVITPLTDFFQDGSMFIYGGETDTTLVNAIRSGDTYVNVHTDVHAGGELRGQIVKDFLCSIMVGIDPLADLISDVRLSPVPVFDELNVTVESQLSGRLSFSVSDLSGKVLSTNQYNMIQGENVVSIPTSSLVPGFYIMMITDGKAAQAYKFVK